MHTGIERNDRKTEGKGKMYYEYLLTDDRWLTTESAKALKAKERVERKEMREPLGGRGRTRDLYLPEVRKRKGRTQEGRTWRGLNNSVSTARPSHNYDYRYSV